MEVTYRLLEFNNTPAFATLKAQLDRIGARYTIKDLGSGLPPSQSLECVIGDRNPHFDAVRELSQVHGYHTQTSVVFSRTEVKTAEWLYVTAGEFQYPQPESDYRPVTYNLDHYCPRCGIGKFQVRPFRLEKDFTQKRRHFFGMHWIFDEIFVRPIVRRVFELAGVTGIQYEGALNHKSGEEIPDLFQLRIDVNPKAGLVTRSLVAEVCQPENSNATLATGRAYSADQPFCGRAKYNYPTRDAIRFDGSCLLGAQDMVKTQESFGSGAGAHRLILVSRRFADIVEANGLVGLKFTPIILE